MLFSLSTAAVLAATLPKFEDYPVTSVHNGSPAEPIIDTPVKKLYRTRIRQGVAKGWGVRRDGWNGAEQAGVNFAGHYFVVTWGCGVPCMMMVIVDSLTGRVYLPPLSIGNSGNETIGLPLLGGGNAQFQYRLNSRLMIMKTSGQLSDSTCHERYYLWEDNRWSLLLQHTVPCP